MIQQAHSWVISRQNSNPKRYMQICVHTSTIHNTQDMETSLTTHWKMNGWRRLHINIPSELLLSHKKWNNAIRSSMDAARDYHTKCKSEKQIPHDTTDIGNLKYDTNEPICKAEADAQTQRTDPWLGEGRVWGAMECKLRVSRCKLLYME